MEVICRIKKGSPGCAQGHKREPTPAAWAFYVVRRTERTAMKGFKRLISALLALATALTLLVTPVSAADAPKEFRAVWVSTIYNLDYPSTTGLSVAQLKSEATEILDNCKAMGMTAVILQVRPNGDALYKSSIYPWSQYLTGKQGVAPSGGFDPLEYWVKEAHKRGLELHAWINPYRVTRSGASDYNNLASTNPAVKHPEWVVKYSDGNYYLDPGIPEVRQLVADGVTEIVKNYDVDGIHMDDYFYPGTGFPDDASYKTYGSAFKNADDWRRDNVNQLVKELDTAIHKLDASVSFGISPFGIWANQSSLSGGSNTNGNQTYFSHYADTRKWVKEGWVDYICPQIYWEIGHSLADYETLVKWWADTVKGTGVKLYIGMADYKAGTTGSWKGITQIEDQIALNATIPEISGEIHFRYQFILSVDELDEFYTQYNNQKTPSVDPNLTSQYSDKAGTGTWTGYSDGSWKFFVKASGKAASGWRKIDNVWYYFDPDTTQMRTDWQQIGGKWYFLRSWGGLLTGWKQEGPAWYYLTENGVTTGWKQVGNAWYYFYDSGVMAANATTPDGHTVNASGARVK